MKTNTIIIACALIAGSIFIFGQNSMGNTVEGTQLIKKVVRGTEKEHAYREIQFVINRNADDYFKEFTHTSLKTFLPGTENIAGVKMTKTLTKNAFPVIGSKRKVYLEDGETAIEEVVALESRYLKYKVTDYTFSKAKPIEYGIGEFRFVPLTKNRLLVIWKYSFKLKENLFPGNLGCLGRTLFRWSFLDSDYAEFMNSSAGAIKAHGERNMQTP